MLKKTVINILIVSSLLLNSAFGQEAEPLNLEPKSIEPIVREHTFGETSQYVFALYIITWLGYFVTQDDPIANHGSSDNYWGNMKHPTYFDYDLFGYNWGLHTFTGSMSFLFYRAKSYSNQDAFLLTALQSFLFEFTIETLTERPSVEDLIFTPIFGSLLGTVLEGASFKLIASDSTFANVLGYILNPPVLLGLHENVKLQPWVSEETKGVALRIDF